MTLDQAKKHFFDEATELGMASEETIEKLATWLEKMVMTLIWLGGFGIVRKKNWSICERMLKVNL